MKYTLAVIFFLILPASAFGADLRKQSVPDSPSDSQTELQASFNNEETEIFRMILRSLGPISPSTSTDSRLFSNLNSILNKIKEALPEKSTTKCTSEKILEFVGLGSYSSTKDVTADNLGIAKYYQSLLKRNPCLTRRTLSFWRQLSADDKEFNLTQPSPDWRNLFSLKPEDRRKDTHKPGWLWKRALATAGNDPKAAILMVSVCSASVAPLQIELDKDESQIELSKDIAALKSMVDKNQKLLEVYKDNPTEASKLNFTRQLLLDRRAKLEENLNSGRLYTRALPCPMGANSSWISKALGEEADITDDLKSRISKLNGLPANLISAKNYHVLTSSMTGCLLASCGLTQDSAARISGLLGKAYRMLALQAEDQEQEQLRSLIIDKLGFDIKNRDLIIQKLSDVNYLGEIVSKMKPTDSEFEVAKSQYEFMLSMPTDSERRTYNLRLLGRIDLLTLREPPARLGSLKIESDSNIGACRALGWKQDRCANALLAQEKIDTDFEWTSSQHALGGRFGADKCKRVKEFSFDDSKFCASEERSPGAPSEFPARKIEKTDR